MELSEPVACTLTGTNLKTQRERWLALSENFGLGWTETEDGFRVAFRSHPAVREQLEAIVAVENECCAWASWAIKRDEAQLVVTARSTGKGVASLHRMLAQFELAAAR